MPTATAAGKAAGRSRCRRQMATSISLTTFYCPRKCDRSRRCGPSWRPRSSRSSTSIGPIDAFPFELLPSFKELGHRRARLCRATAAQAAARSCSALLQMELARVDPSICDLLWRAQRPGDGLDLSRWIGGAEAEMAAADGALRKDRLLRPDRAAGWFGSQRRSDRRRPSAKAIPGFSMAQKRWIGNAPWCDLSIIWARDLGGQPGQGIHRREQVHARLQRREDRAQDRAQGGPERPYHAEGCSSAGGEPSAGRQFVPRYREGAEDDAIHGGLDVNRHPMGAFEARAQV